MRDISIIIPAYNEQKILHENLVKIYSFISKKFPGRCKFIIVDSNSTDETPQICKKFVKNHSSISYKNIDYNGKGEKIKFMTLRCNTPYAGWIDSDIPLKLEEYCKMMHKVVSDKADLSISSRYAKGARIKRRITRLFCSRLYHTLVRILFFINVSDTTSGAKFWNYEITKNVWPLVKGTRWFFDTELVYYCINKGYRISEVPVTFEDREDSRFNIIRDGYKTNRDMLKFRLRTLFSK